MPPTQKTYVCVCVIEHRRPVLLVCRPDGDWCFLCGDDHPEDASNYRAVGLGHLIEADATLDEVLDLDPDFEAERAAVGAAWVRSAVPTE